MYLPSTYTVRQYKETSLAQGLGSISLPQMPPPPITGWVPQLLGQSAVSSVKKVQDRVDKPLRRVDPSENLPKTRTNVLPSSPPPDRPRHVPTKFKNTAGTALRRAGEAMHHTVPLRPPPSRRRRRYAVTLPATVGAHSPRPRLWPKRHQLSKLAFDRGWPWHGLA